MIHRASTVSLPNLNTCHQNLRTSDKQQASEFQLEKPRIPRTGSFGMYLSRQG